MVQATSRKITVQHMKIRLAFPRWWMTEDMLCSYALVEIGMLLVIFVYKSRNMMIFYWCLYNLYRPLFILMILSILDLSNYTNCMEKEQIPLSCLYYGFAELSNDPIKYELMKNCESHVNQTTFDKALEICSGLNYLKIFKIFIHFYLSLIST